MNRDRKWLILSLVAQAIAIVALIAGHEMNRRVDLDGPLRNIQIIGPEQDHGILTFRSGPSLSATTIISIYEDGSVVIDPHYSAEEAMRFMWEKSAAKPCADPSTDAIVVFSREVLSLAVHGNRTVEFGPAASKTTNVRAFWLRAAELLPVYGEPA